jgi:cytochrome b pre-mRNA-processing protein 3
VAGEQQSAAGWWQRLTGGVQARRERRSAAETLYASLVRQAREPFLFAELEAPDTREGRLEMVLLHAVLVLRRLQQEGEAGRTLAQVLFDLMFADIDQHLREWGVGDLSVGKEVKKVAQTFYARAAAMEPGLADGEPESLVPVLLRNLYGDDEGSIGPARGLATYLVGQSAWLREQSVDLRQGRILFRATSPVGIVPSGKPRQGRSD